VRPARQGGRDLRLTSRTRPSRGGPVASFTKLIKDFARSPKGQQLIEQAKEQASKPENRRKLEELRRRYVKR
jgi:Zn-dependent M32 family carboxypeptidase